MAKVSVLIPVYNVEKYLEQCLDSIIKQTFTDIEIICVNDGSTDKSGDILKRYAVKDSRIVIVNKKNGGLPSARNAGIDAAKGKYLSFVDADDYIRPDMIEKLYNTAVKSKAEIVICGANIFPEEPRANNWLYTVLSPQEEYYEKCSDDLLFKNPASRPFIWRTFVSKALIDRNNFRLREDIHIGEDNAFQFRVYPKADGIALIPDKLYNYRWFREDSLMNSVVYKNVEKKCLSHIKMVLHVAEEWEKSGDIQKFGKGFLKWSVEFLYDDFIKLPLNERIENAKALTDVWTKAGFFRYQYSFPDYIRDMFRYFYSVAEEKMMNCKVSVVISTDVDYPFLEEAIKSCLGQTVKELELVLINNGSSPASYSVIYNYLCKDKRVRVYNTGKGHYSEGYNIALKLCKGKYIHFMYADDFFQSSDALEKWVKQSENENSDVALSLYKSEDNEIYTGTELSLKNSSCKDYFTECVLGNALFSSDFVQKQNLTFKNYSLESGKAFLAAAFLSAKKTVMINKSLYVSRNVYRHDWIPTWECVFLLRSFADRLELAKKYKSRALHNKIYSLLVSDYYVNLLVNNTKPYFMSLNDCPNGENSQKEVLEQMIRILSLIDPDMLPESEDSAPLLPSLFSKMVDERHKYIGDVSDRYARS